MKQTHSRSFIRSARVSLLAAGAVLFGSAAAVAQSTGASSSTSGTATNADRYSSGSATRDADTSRRDTDANRRNRQQSDATGSSTDTYTGASTSAAAAGSRSNVDARAERTESGRAYGTSTDRSSTTAEGRTYESDTATRGSDRLRWGDRRFVTKAADSGVTELQLAQLAAERASNPEVRRFAQRLIDDHSTVNSELTSIAGRKNVKLDDEDGKDRHYRRLSRKSGTEFDREFVEHMVEMHEDDVKLFEKAAKDAKDAELRSFASKHIDHLRDHLQQAQNLRQTIIPTGRTADETSRASAEFDRSTSGTATGTTSGSESSSRSRQSETETSTDYGTARSSGAEIDARESTESGSSSRDPRRDDDR